MHEQDEILKRIQESINPATEEAEPSEPTESDEATEVTEEVMEAETETDEVADPEPEEADAEPSYDDEELYVEIDGREISLKDIKEWEQGNLRQSDYTRKTQELAEQRKQLEAQTSDLRGKTEALDDAIVQLEALNDQKDAEINWDELREYDPSEYLKQKELQEQREAALGRAKQERYSLSQEQIQAQAKTELDKLVQTNPQWVENGKETPAYKEDMDRVRTYLNDIGYTEEQQAGILLTGHGQAYIDAAKFHLGKKSNAVVAKKVRKAPVVTKPGGVKDASQDRLKKAEKRLKNARGRDAIAAAADLYKARHNAA